MIPEAESLQFCRPAANSASRCIIALLLFLCAPVSRTRQGNADEALIQRIQHSDIEAIAQAGRSGDRAFVPYLREHLKTKTKNRVTAGPARIALARLGETEQLQEVWCSAISNGYDEIGALNLGSVGGWFAIRGLEKLLTPKGVVQPRKLTQKEKGSDALHDSIGTAALKTLPTVIPSPLGLMRRSGAAS